MPKPKTTAKLVDDAAKLLQQLVRMKAALDSGQCQCVTCKHWFHWKDMDGGHFLSRRYKSTKLIEEQINPQCKKCNGWPDYFTHANYEEFMVDRHGKDYVEWLKAETRKVKKFLYAEVEEVITYAKEQIAIQRERLGE